MPPHSVNPTSASTHRHPPHQLSRKQGEWRRTFSFVLPERQKASSIPSRCSASRSRMLLSPIVCFASPSSRFGRCFQILLASSQVLATSDRWRKMMLPHIVPTRRFPPSWTSNCSQIASPASCGCNPHASPGNGPLSARE